MLRGALAGQRRHVLLATVLLASHQVAEALVPVMVGVVIDRAVTPGDGGALVWTLALLAGLFVVLSWAFRLGYRAAQRAQEGAAHELRVALAERILDPAGGADRGRLPGALLSIATSDARRAAGIDTLVPIAAGVLAAIVVAAVVLLGLSLELGLLVVLGLPPLLLVVHAAGRPLARRSAAEQEGAARAAGIATDLVTGLRVLKGIGAESAAVARYRGASRSSLDATLRTARAEAAYEGATVALTGAFLVLVALVAGRLAADGTISIGELVAAVGLTQFLVGPLERMAWVGTQLAQARASAARVEAVLAAPAAVGGGGVALAQPVRGELDVSDLTHGTLRALSLDVAAGAFVGVVTGAPEDATALLDCLAREEDPEGGTIALDGIDLGEVDPAQARRAMLVAAHDAHLFEGTLAEAVAGDRARDGGDRVQRALAASAADEVAAALPGGLEAQLTERGRSLSGGQRQRVALARAVAVQSPVLVLHDPTTAVDAATEARIASGLRTARAGRTTIVVTTSPALLAACDRVVVVEGGAVVAAGTHAELLRDHPGYREAVLA